MIFQTKGRRRKIKKYYVSLSKETAFRALTWEEVMRSKSLSEVTNEKHTNLQSTIFENSLQKAIPTRIDQVEKGAFYTSPSITDIPHLSILERLALRLGGSISVGKSHSQSNGFREFFLRRCSRHGIILTYPQGYDNLLRCSECIAQSQYPSSKSTIGKPALS
jgi:hypothetical protein